MTNKEIKEYKIRFNKLNLYTYIENFCGQSLSVFDVQSVGIKFDDNLNLHIKFDFLDKGIYEFDLEFKGNLVNINNRIGFRKKYFRLFNRVCKGSYKFSVIKDEIFKNNLYKFFYSLDINNIFYDEMILLFEIFINSLIIKKYVKYMYDYDIIKYNQKIIDKRVQKYEEKIKRGFCKGGWILFYINRDKLLDDTERLYLIEKYEINN